MGLGSAGGWNVGKTLNKFKENMAAGNYSATPAGATQEARGYSQQALDNQVQLNQPYIEKGRVALSSLADGNFDVPEQQFGEAQPGAFVDNTPQQQPFNYGPFTFQQDPGAAYRQQQAQKAIERSAAARGNTFAGGTLKALAGEISGMASQEYGAAADRYANNRNFAYGQYQDQNTLNQNTRSFNYGKFQDTLGQYNINRTNFNQSQLNRRQGMQDRFTRLSTLAGLGESAAARTGQAYTNFGQQNADLTMGLQNNRTAEKIAKANNQTDMLGNVLKAGATLLPLAL